MYKTVKSAISLLLVISVTVSAQTPISKIDMGIPLSISLQQDTECDENDYEQAWVTHLKKAKLGDTESQYMIGVFYRDGIGVEQNNKEAAYWFRKAGRNGHAYAQCGIAKMFAEGQGVLQDWRIAAEWYWRAAEQGIAEAQYELASMYRDGIGMEKDLEKARKWYAKAAEQSYSDAYEQMNALPTIKKNADKSKNNKSKSRHKKYRKGSIRRH